MCSYSSERRSRATHSPITDRSRSLTSAAAWRSTYIAAMADTAIHAIVTARSCGSVPACAGRTTWSRMYPARYGGTRLASVIAAAADSPNASCLRYGRMCPSSRRRTAPRRFAINACASLTGRATASA